MRIDYASHAARALNKAHAFVQKAFYKQIGFLLRDLNHPSLHAKKYDETTGLWQARVNDDWRFYFTIANEVYLIHEIRKYPK